MPRRGLAGLDDEPRSGRPRTIDQRADRGGDVDAAAEEVRGDALVSPAAGRHLRIGNATVAKAWRDYGVQPWRAETFKFSTDPELVAKVTDVVGLYLAPPENAIVLCVDEKSQIQALDRTATMLPMQPGPARAAHPRLRPARHHDAVRRVGHRHRQGHRRAASRGTGTRSSSPSSNRSPAPTPTGELHLVMDNYAAHKHPEVRDWLAANPRIHVHFTPTSGSWLNLVEVWFGIIERQAIHRGTFTSVRDLNTKIRAFINGWNDRCHPFVWTKTADADPARRPTVRRLQTRTTSSSHEPLHGEHGHPPAT